MLSLGGWEDPGCREGSRVGPAPELRLDTFCCLCQGHSYLCLASWRAVIHTGGFKIPFPWGISSIGSNSHPVVPCMLLLHLSAGHGDIRRRHPPSSGFSSHAEDEPGEATGFLAPLFGVTPGVPAASRGASPFLGLQ